MKQGQPKNIQKSIRISEDVAAYIDKQEGNGFNEKFCNMVLYCMEHEAEIKELVKAAEQRLEYVESQIDKKHDILTNLRILDDKIKSCLNVIQ